jgi:hypothetical protein
MGTLLPNAVQTFTGPNGTPLSGGSVYFYIPGTTTPKNTWQDPAQTILNTNPVVLNANGQAIIWGSGQYRQQVYDANNNLIWDQVTEDTSGGILGNMVDNRYVSGTGFTPGTTTQLTLASGPGSIANTWVYFDGVYQAPDTYSVSGMTVTFNAAIPVGTQEVNIKVGSTVSIGVPANGSVTASALAPNAAAANLSNSAINQVSSNQIYVGSGALIQRLNDRLFVGAATVNDGAYPTSSPDWLSQLQAGTFGVNGGSVPFAQFASLTNSSPFAGSGVTSGAQTKYFTSATSSAIGIQSFGYANNGTYAAVAWAYYGECHRLSAADGSAYGIEISVVNRGGAPVIQTPYAGPIGLSTGIQIDSGNSFSATQEPGLSPASSAMTIVQNTSDNSAPFLKGIIFSENSIQLNSGIAESISFFQGCSIQWYGPGGNQTSAIYCQGTTLAASTHQVFLDNSVQFLNSNAGQTIFSVSSNPGVANSINIAPAASGASPLIEAQGSDTNIGIAFQMKGSASPAFVNTALATSATSGSASGLPATPAQYFIVYLNGTEFKIPAYNA